MKFNQEALEKFIKENPEMLKMVCTSIKDTMVYASTKDQENADDALFQYDQHLDNYVDNYLVWMEEE